VSESVNGCGRRRTESVNVRKRKTYRYIRQQKNNRGR
jgi:hypothetical protein